MKLFWAVGYVLLSLPFSILGFIIAYIKTGIQIGFEYYPMVTEKVFETLKLKKEKK